MRGRRGWLGRLFSGLISYGEVHSRAMWRLFDGLEKGSFAAAIPLLYAADRVTAVWLGFAAMAATWLVLFAVAFWRTPKKEGTTDGCNPPGSASYDGLSRRSRAKPNSRPSPRL